MSSEPVLKLGTHTLPCQDILETLVRCQLLPTLYRELILDREIAQIECLPEQVAAAIAEFYERQQISEADRAMWQQQQHLSDAQIEQIATRSLRIEQFKQQRWGNRVEAYFMQRKADLDQVIYSLLRTTNPEIAQELYFRIQAQEATFADLAPQYSEGAEAETAGKVGPVALAQFHPALAEKLMQAQPQQLLPPTRLGDWYVLLRLEQWMPARLDAVRRQQLLDELCQAWLDEQVRLLQPCLILPTLVAR